MKKSLVAAILAVFVIMGSNIAVQAKTDSSVKDKKVKVEAPAKENIAKDKDKKTLTDKDKQQPPQFDGKNAPDGSKQPPKDSDGKQPPQFDGKNAPDGTQPPVNSDNKKLSK